MHGADGSRPADPPEKIAIEGASLRLLTPHIDDRGALTELMRMSWLSDMPQPKQWNFTRSHPNVLRGVHVHAVHWDFLIFLDGKATVGLVDFRTGSATYRKTQVLRLGGEPLSLLTIQPGIGHGFYFPDGGTYIYGLSSYWDPVNDEFGCRWDDPALGLVWGIEATPILSPRDDSAGTAGQMLKEMRGKAPWCE